MIDSWLGKFQEAAITTLAAANKVAMRSSSDLDQSSPLSGQEQKIQF